MLTFKRAVMMPMESHPEVDNQAAEYSKLRIWAKINLCMVYELLIQHYTCIARTISLLERNRHLRLNRRIIINIIDHGPELQC